MIPLFLGYDKREAVGYHVCVESLIRTATAPFTVAPVFGDRRDGTNDFIYSRFLVPYLCDYQGWAIFADGSDMLFREDIAHLWALRSARNAHAVLVVQRHYKTRHPRKYIGTDMESHNRDYPCKNWSSLMLFNCAHPANRVLTPEYIRQHGGEHLHTFGWLPSSAVGALPARWNVLMGEEGEDAECAVAHYTLGIPFFNHYKKCTRSKEWWDLYHESH